LQIKLSVLIRNRFYSKNPLPTGPHAINDDVKKGSHV